MSQEDRLSLALVCKTWLEVARSARFNYPLRVLMEETELNRFVEIFSSHHSEFLPIDCIEIHMETWKSRNVNFWMMARLREILESHPQVKLTLHTDAKPCHFKFLYDSLPMVKIIHWELSNNKNLKT